MTPRPDGPDGPALRLRARRASLARAAALVAVLACVALSAVGHLAGVRMVPVLSGSMTPYAPQGSLVATVPLRAAQAAVGDVIAFLPPAPFDSGGHPVLHRVAAVTPAPPSTHSSGPRTAALGAAAITTRGDANPGPDPWTLAADGADLGRAVAVVPLAGWVVMAGPGALLLLLVGAALVAEARHLLRRRPCTCGASPTPA